MSSMGHSPRLSCMSSSGGMGPSATVTIKRLASLMAEKADTPYSVMLNVIRCKLSFSLVDSAIMCIRGARSSLRRPAVSFDSSLVPDPVRRPLLYSPPPSVWKRLGSKPLHRGRSRSDNAESRITARSCVTLRSMQIVDRYEGFKAPHRPIHWERPYRRQADGGWLY